MSFIDAKFASGVPVFPNAACFSVPDTVPTVPGDLASMFNIPLVPTSGLPTATCPSMPMADLSRLINMLASSGYRSGHDARPVSCFRQSVVVADEGNIRRSSLS